MKSQNFRTRNNMVVYLSGPISGVADYKQNFEKAQQVLENLSVKYNLNIVVLNPAVLPEGLLPEEYMDIDLAMVRVADVILLLDGWHQSPGAELERDLAKYSRKPVYLIFDFIDLWEDDHQISIYDALEN